MLRRSVYGVAALAMLGALAGCYTPTGPTPARIESVEVSPRPAHPGDTVTVRVEASHSVGIFNGVPHALVNPQGSRLRLDNCSSSLEFHGDDTRRATITFACALPELVSNGTWALLYGINYSAPTDYPFQPPPPPDSTATFEVIGGSDDVSPPTLVSYSISPGVITRGTPFTVTARVRDDSPMFMGHWNSPNSHNIVFRGSGYSNTCRGGILTPVSATEADVVYNCDGGWIGPVGPLTGHVSGDVLVRDALYNNARLPLTIDFQAAD